MKMFKITVFLVCCLLSSAVKAEAKILAKPFQAEQNLKLYQKSMETTELDIEEGSGQDTIDDDDDDYDEYDDDDYYYDDDDEYSSGDVEWLPHEDSAEINAELIPDNDPKESDFHFKEDHDNAIDDLLYEYNNEYYYEDDDDDYLDQVEQDLESENQEVVVTKQADQDLSGGKFIFQPSYIFLMLTSALISFAIFILAFILCRRSVQRHHKKNHMVPFIVSSTDFSSSKHYSSPIVKNYQRVPTSTKELMQHSSVVEMMQNQNQSERPLLAKLT